MTNISGQKNLLRMPRTVWLLDGVSLLMDMSSEMIHSLLPVFLTVAMGIMLTLARFSEVFLVLRAYQGGRAVTFVPLVLIFMNAAYALLAYPLGKLAPHEPPAATRCRYRAADRN